MSESKIIIADDHPMFLEGLEAAIIKQQPNVYIQAANNYLALFSVLDNDGDDIDLLIMDLRMPGATSETGLFYIRKRYPELPIIVLSAHDTIDIRMKCLESGASDFISKSIDVNELVTAIMEMLSGYYQYPNTTMYQKNNISAELDRLSSLTPSQFKVLHLISNGHANKNIADLLNISENTVKNHITAIFDKLGVTNRTQACNIFNQQ